MAIIQQLVHTVNATTVCVHGYVVNIIEEETSLRAQRQISQISFACKSLELVKTRYSGEQ